MYMSYPMNSKSFTSIAQVADYEFGADVVAITVRPACGDTFPAAWVVLFHPIRKNFSTHMFVETETPHFTWGHYDMTFEEAMQVQNRRVAGDAVVLEEGMTA